MAMHSITVTFRDYLGKTAKVTVSKGTTLKDAEQMADVLKKYSRAAVIACSHTETTFIDDDETGAEQATATTSGEHYDRVQQKCKLNYTDADTGDKISLSIPAPNDNCFDADQEPTGDVAEDIADAIGNSTTRESGNLIYRGGGLVSKLPQVKKARRTGI